MVITQNQDTQRLLNIYLYYRLGLGILLAAVYWGGESLGLVGSVRPALFTNVIFFYLTVCTLSIISQWGNLIPGSNNYFFGLLVFDFVVLVITIYASGNLTTGLGYLLLVPMAVGSTFLKQQTNFGLAAFGTLLILLMSLVHVKEGIGDTSTVFSAGITGLLLFGTAISFQAFSRKLQSSERTAKKQSEHASYLQSVSQRIVETMQVGVLVVDHNIRIQLINHSAAQLLTINGKFKELTDISELNHRLSLWKNDGVIPSAFNLSLVNDHYIRINFASLPATPIPSIMLFVEDMAHIGQEAQQLKLASLGRLTASIAHEIRNPLGAISHASQLLDESTDIDDGDRQLLDIIQSHSLRINDIINSILTFSRRRVAKTEKIDLVGWLHDFKSDYLLDHAGELELSHKLNHLDCHIDPTHLYQIITNLVDNGMRYSEEQVGRRLVEIDISQTTDKNPCLKIKNKGSGIPQEKRDSLFEPFYTTGSSGSGLGLFICKELCESNQVDISYSYNSTKQISIFMLVLH